MDSLDSIGKFLWRNKDKIILTGALLGSVGLLYYYNSNVSNAMLEEWSHAEGVEEDTDRSLSEDDMFINRARQLPEVKKAQLVKIRRQFENARQKFLPTLRVKIFEVVDCSDTIQELRRLRSTSSASLQRDAEEALWEKIKIQSISILFVSVYMSCVVCTVLKLQFHLLGNYSNQGDSSLHGNSSQLSGNGNLSQSMMSDVTLSPISHARSDNRHGATSSAASAGASAFSSDLFLALIEQSYSHLLHEGMAALGKLCQDKTAAIFGSQSSAGAGGPQHKWYYKNTTSYEDLVGDLMALRHSIEADLDANVIQLALLPPDSEDSAIGDSSMLSGLSATSPDRVRLYSPVSPEDSSAVSDDRDQSALSDVPLTPGGHATPQSFVSASPYGYSTGSFPDSSVGSSGSDYGVQLILNQLWDIVESPNYRVVLQEAVDTSFQRLFEELKHSKFVIAHGDGSSIATSSSNTTSATTMTGAGAELARPPLAILLPEFRKLVNSSLLPENPLVVSKIASEISSSSSLDALCVLAYDSMDFPSDGSFY